MRVTVRSVDKDASSTCVELNVTAPKPRWRGPPLPLGIDLECVPSSLVDVVVGCVACLRIAQPASAGVKRM